MPLSTSQNGTVGLAVARDTEYKSPFPSQGYHIRQPSSPSASGPFHMLFTQLGECHCSVHTSFKVQLKCVLLHAIFPDTRLEFIVPSCVPRAFCWGLFYGSAKALIKMLICTPTAFEGKTASVGVGGSPEKLEDHLSSVSCSSKPRLTWLRSFLPSLACSSNHTCAGPGSRPPTCAAHGISSLRRRGRRTLL